MSCKMTKPCCYQLYKKNAYALKTPRVVALPFIYGVECIIISIKIAKTDAHTDTHTHTDSGDIAPWWCILRPDGAQVPHIPL